MEVGPWRCGQGPNQCKLTLCLCGHWSLVFCHDTGDNDICSPWFPFSFEPWRFNESYAAIMGVYGFLCRVCIVTSI